MRFPRFRFTILRMMIAVAIVGAVFGMWRRSRAFSHTAAMHHNEALGYQAHIFRLHKRRTATQQHDVRLSMALDDYHSGLSLKYQQAARRTWLPVEPDPPEPR